MFSAGSIIGGCMAAARLAGVPAMLAAIQLLGVSGEKLRARAFFDANNVKVGDPLVLTLDFLGQADFADLHPPALSRQLDKRDWKLDDESAKTDTYRTARRVTYRVRPMRPGVLWFPELEFTYDGPDGKPRTVRSNAIPVHAKPGTDVVVAGMAEDENAMPQPDALVTAPPEGLADDAAFAWRKACAKPTADAFAAFDFPAAKLNEARCATLAGDWKRALAVYRRLEWRTGQTPELERGMLAALAVRYQNPQVELPVWRQVGRPVLKYGWQGRVGIVGGGLVALVLVFWALGRLIRVLACVALAALVALPAVAAPKVSTGSQQGRATRGAGQDPFAAMEQMHRRMQQQMQQMMGDPFGGGFGGGFSFNGEPAETPKVAARVLTSKRELHVGEPFEFILELEFPKTADVSNVRLAPSSDFGLKFTGGSQNMTDGRTADTNNVVRRLAIPARYDVPYAGPLSFTVNGMVAGRQKRGRGRNSFSFTFSNSFETKTPVLALAVKPPDGQPPDYAGFVANRVRFTERLDLARVGTNDVVQITYRVEHDGFLPEEFLPPGAAFEIGRSDDGRVAEWRRFFVADGTAATPVCEIVWYEPASKSFKRRKAGGTRVVYQP